MLRPVGWDLRLSSCCTDSVMKSIPRVKKHKDAEPFGNSADRREALSEQLLF